MATASGNKKTPKVFGQLYRATNEESVLNTLMTHFSGLLGLRLLPMLREQAPDLILSTHPFATEMISPFEGERACTGAFDLFDDGLWAASRLDCAASGCLCGEQ